MLLGTGIQVYITLNCDASDLLELYVAIEVQNSILTGRSITKALNAILPF